MTSRALRLLAADLVDYAGLFPPASRSMPQAVAEFATHRAAPECWMLGRFVVPAGRLDELAAELERQPSGADGALRVAALAGPDLRGDLLRIHDVNTCHRGVATVDVLEAKASSVADVARLADAVAGQLALYVELPLADDPAPLLDAVRAAGVSAKVRTGGVTLDAFPSTAQVARFIVRCAERRVRWKATAGLHHPLRAEFPLTYADDAPRGTMFGFLNVFAAGAFAWSGMTGPEVAHLLEERDARAIVLSDEGICWRGHVLSLARLADARAAFAASFGSCSFREPVDDLRAIGLL